MKERRLLTTLVAGCLLLANCQQPISGEETVPEQLNEYTNRELGLSFKYPSSWNAMTPEELIIKTKGVMSAEDLEGTVVAVVNDRDPDNNFNLKSFAIPKDSLTEAELRELDTYFSQEYEKFVPGYQKVSSRILTVSDVKGLEMVFDSIRVDKPLRQKSVILVEGGRDFVLTFTSPKESFSNSDEECFETILATFIIQAD